jgi:hypothetical protein
LIYEARIVELFIIFAVKFAIDLILNDGERRNGYCSHSKVNGVSNLSSQQSFDLVNEFLKSSKKRKSQNYQL